MHRPLVNFANNRQFHSHVISGPIKHTQSIGVSNSLDYMYLGQGSLVKKYIKWTQRKIIFSQKNIIANEPAERRREAGEAAAL